MISGERSGVQNRIIEYAKEIGWNYINPDDAIRLRGGETGIIFREIFKNEMVKLNPDIDPGDIDNLIKNIETVSPDIKGNREIWEYLKGLKTIFIPYKKRDLNLNLIDFKNIERNVFNITDEYKFTNGRYTIRADIIFLINGIPLFIVETKSAHKINAIMLAIDQIKRYHMETPELMTVLQSFQITDLLKFYYGPTFNVSDSNLLNWKDENNPDFESLIKSFFEKKRIISIIENYILFTEKDGEIKKVTLRQHQMRAVSKIINRCESENARGLIWHTQGSGKTYTMIVSARMILDDPKFENPTLIMVVDRNELESQMFQNLSSIGFGNIVVAETKTHLNQLLREDHRGLIVTTIQKFDGMFTDISLRKNIFVFIDEAHRTTNNKLGNFMMGALPNATFIGFTGTPVSGPKSNTFRIFGGDDKNGYLDKYGIKESINDGTTLPMNYTIAPARMLVDKETLDREFLDLVESEGISDVEDLNKILEKNVTLKNMMKNPERIDEIAKYIANHYKNNVEPLGYKAFVVAVDREACVLYKDALNKYLPESYSEVIMSYSNNDKENMKKYYKSEDQEKEIRKRFQNPDEDPKILIVTDKLLTGFDAPILYAMYLDKPMRDHVLLQAIARINRPYQYKTRIKKYGFIMDFVGIFGSLKKALAFDSSDIKDIEGVLKDIKELKKEFKSIIESMKKQYLDVINEKSRDKIIENILEIFKDPEKRKNYLDQYSRLSDIYDILSPDKFLSCYESLYKDLTNINSILMKTYGHENSKYYDLSKKTAELVKNNTIISRMPGDLNTYIINDETINKIRKSKESDREKVFNLLISIKKYIDENKKNSPFLISIGDRANQIAESYNNNIDSSEEVLQKIYSIIKDINNSNKEKSQLGFPKEVFAFYYLIKTAKYPYPEELSNIFLNEIKIYKSWYSNTDQERIIKRELIKNMIAKHVLNVEEIARMLKDTMDKLRGAINE